MGRSPRVGIGVGSTGAEYPYPGVLGLVDAVEGPGRGAARTDGDAPGEGWLLRSRRRSRQGIHSEETRGSQVGRR